MSQFSRALYIDLVEAAQRKSTARKTAQRAVKRLVDLIMCLVLLPILAPILVAIAIAVRLDSPGPALFRQLRVGRGGKLFVPLKFRSMLADTDELHHREAIRRLAQGEPVAVIDGKPAFKPADDPRVTRIGKSLRATGLDELPQLFNIIKGEMSLVGPRPAIPYELEHYKDWYYGRFTVRPGVTGLWQVKREETHDMDDVIHKDLEYVERFSLWLDIKIIAETVPRILFRGWNF